MSDQRGRIQLYHDADQGKPLRVAVLYDFASSLCYVALRSLERIREDVRELGVELVWSPVDLATLTAGYRRGAPLTPRARANVERVAGELRVELHTPPHWIDSRAAHAFAILAERAGREAGWRERAFTAVFEERRDVEDPETLRAMARELDFEPSLATGGGLDEALEELVERTAAAREAMVTGVPSFLLGSWPLPGIQDDDTMLRILGRFASRARNREGRSGTGR